MSNFATTFSVEQTPAEVFDAVTNVRGWWSEEIEGSTDQLDAEFRYHRLDLHRCTMKVTELVPGERVVWRVLDNYFDFTEDKSEWLGTEVRFELSATDEGTQLRFAHIGLVPEYECFDICSNAWGAYIRGSLRNLITTGQGQPNPKEDPADMTVARERTTRGVVAAERSGR